MSRRIQAVVLHLRAVFASNWRGVLKALLMLDRQKIDGGETEK